MASKPRNVDLGPMSLQVGGDSGAPAWSPPEGNANQGDVSRFDSIMNRHRGRGRDEPAASEALSGELPEPELHQMASADDLGAEVAYLWAGTGLDSDREVRVGLRETLLPETAVRLCEDQGRLLIEFTCGQARVANWLVRKLPLLARTLGTKLDRTVELVVFMADGSVAGSCAWPEGV